MRFSAVNKFFVNFVRKNKQIVPLAHLRNFTDFLFRIHGARRIAGTVEYKHFSARGYHAFYLTCGQLIAVARLSHHENGNAAAAFYDLGICKPVRFGNKHLVAGVYRGEKRVENRVLRPV